MKRIPIAVLVSAGSLIACQTAFADSSGAGWYVGAGLGLTTVKDTGGTENLTSYSRDSHSTGGKLFVGYQFTENFGIEGAYTDFGKETFSYTATGVTGSGDLKANAFTLAATGRLPLGNSFALLGKAGAAGMQVKYRDSWVDSGTPGSLNGNKTTVVPMLGVGFEYMLNKSYSWRAEYEAYGKANIVDGSSFISTPKLKTQMLSLSFGYHF